MHHDVCLVSECEISREGLSNILRLEGFNVAGTFGSVSELSDADVQDDAFIVLDGVDACDQSNSVRELKQKFGSASIVILADHFDFPTMLDCFQAGLHSYIVRAMKALPLTAALRLAAMGERVLPPDLVDLFDHQHTPPLMRNAEHAGTDIECVRLSPRERDVLCCLMAGYSNKVIARELLVCEATVKVHVKAILRKLNVHNRTQAAIWASSRGISEMSIHS